MRSEGWVSSGFTSAVLFGVTIDEPGKHPRCAILKIKPHVSRSGSNERTAHQAARQDSEQFASEHMVGLPCHALGFEGGGQLMFQDVAGGGFDELIGSGEIAGRHIAVTDTYRLIIKSLLTEWNTGTNRVSGRTSAVPAGKLLAALLGARIEPGGTVHAWAAAHPGLLPDPRRWLRHGDLPVVNPFALARDESFARTVTVLNFPGKIHGDLHPDNLLVAKAASEPIRYYLVDLSRYDPQGPLPWDPAYLMLTTAAHHLSTLRHVDRPKLRTALLDPANPHEGVLPAALVQTMKGIHQGELEHIDPLGQAANWRKLRLVCVAAIGLILSGRQIITEVDREWFFWLSAFAATELFGDTVPDKDPLVLPDSLVARSPQRIPASRPAGHEEIAARAAKADHARKLLDREDQQLKLRTRLSTGVGGIVIVHGPSGAGKSTLVDAVLAEVEQSTRTRPRRREAVPDIPFDVRTLTEAVTSDSAPPTAERDTKSSIARLEGALGDEPVIIVVENAENLLNSASGKLADLDLDEAFELLSTSQHAVTLVLVTSSPLHSPHGGTWPRKADTVEVHDLPYEHFVEFIKTLDDVYPSGLSELSPDLSRRFHQAVHGIPRDAEIAHAILTLDDSTVDAPSLAEQLTAVPSSATPRLLAQILLDGVSFRRRVLDALAAFAVPVASDALVAVLAEELREPQIRIGLRQLIARRIVRQASNQVYLPPSEVRKILDEELESSHSSLLHQAAYELRKHRPTSVRSLADLRIHFAEVSCLIRARRFAAAHGAIESIDRFLRDWNCSHLLREQSIAVQGRTKSPTVEIANDNRLGHLHSLAGEFGAASDAYGRALKIAEQRRDTTRLTTLRSNLASMYARQNQTGRASGYYDLALHDAVAGNQPTVAMAAMEGLADCRRRWGRYDEAIIYAEQALEVYDRIELVSDRKAAASRAFQCTLKLARWHSELGSPERAAHYLKTAQRTTAQHPDLFLAGAYLDARADFELGCGEIGPATETATAAEDYALRIADPVTLMQARTTLCVARLAVDDRRTAAQQIIRALRYRRVGRALIVLALRALTERLLNHTDSADDCFRQLYEETAGRIRLDNDDFTAWDMQGFALCGLDPTGPAVLDRAVRAFRTARDLATSPTPLLVDRLRFMLAQLDRDSRHPGLLQPAIDGCGTGSSRADSPD
ncbi:AAA family ATPase [Amycolatopsis mongoliensis]|uniref:AAA family ATPase n=1 Tax=Amycolatopsis mongoliensis TaxID=715475 RepID=A0A9Y2ND13_9PSEU|nr:AAA family ATPase [Amycolatopsis sp. 4-36]WIY01246.1 AAA family ATPase [Amycolatopsis sp. 4-36]